MSSVIDKLSKEDVRPCAGVGIFEQTINLHFSNRSLCV